MLQREVALGWPLLKLLHSSWVYHQSKFHLIGPGFLWFCQCPKHQHQMFSRLCRYVALFPRCGRARRLKPDRRLCTSLHCSAEDSKALDFITVPPIAPRCQPRQHTSKKLCLDFDLKQANTGKNSETMDSRESLQ